MSFPVIFNLDSRLRGNDEFVVSHRAHDRLITERVGAMAWFQKFLGLGKKENTILTLKLRLNRWRHFLRTEWSCALLVEDLKEKSVGEYIFDRQYIFSTVGRIFQQAYQAAYDGTLLMQNPDEGLYRWLDRQKEEALSYLSEYRQGKNSPEQDRPPTFTPSAIRSGSREGIEEEQDLDQEPEFRMLKGVIERLEGGNNGNQTLPPENIEAVKGLRMALRWTHEQVLRELLKPEIIQQWIDTGLAVPWGDQKTGSLYVIDLGRESASGNNPPKDKKILPEGESSFTAWPLVQEVLKTFSRGSHGDSGENNRSLYFILNENALFLYSLTPEAVILMDMVLTNVRELNHFFFHWQGSGDGSSILKRLPPWAWTYQQAGKVFELVVFQRPPKEIEGYGIQIGAALA